MWPRTAKEITDLLLPQTSVSYTLTVPLRSQRSAEEYQLQHPALPSSKLVQKKINFNLKIEILLKNEIVYFDVFIYFSPVESSGLCTYAFLFILFYFSLAESSGVHQTVYLGLSIDFM